MFHYTEKNTGQNDSLPLKSPSVSFHFAFHKLRPSGHQTAFLLSAQLNSGDSQPVLIPHISLPEPHCSGQYWNYYSTAV